MNFRSCFNAPFKKQIHKPHNDTKSNSANKALRQTKEQNAIPRSQQPGKVLKPRTDAFKNAGLVRGKNLKQYQYTSSKGEKVIFRVDEVVKYGDGEKGDQTPHFNAG